MRRRTVSRERQLDRRLLAELDKALTLSGETPETISKLLGCSLATYYNKRKEPFRFTLGDIRRLVRHFDMDAEAVCGLIGVNK